MDFIKPKKPNLTSKDIARIGRYTTLILMVVAASWAPMIQKFPGMFHYIQSAFAYVVPPVVAIFFMGMLWKRGSRNAAFWTLVSGHSISLVLFVLSQTGYFNLHFTITAGLLTAVSFGIFILVSLLNPAPDVAESEEVFWRKEDAKPAYPMPWYKDYRWHAAGILLLTALMIIGFF